MGTEVLGTLVGRWYVTLFGVAFAVLAVRHRSRSAMPVLEYATAVLLGVWIIWVIDPISRLGAHFFLGELFRYEGPGFWFGLPLGSQLGFVLTQGLLIALLTWLARDEPASDVDRLLDHPRLGALGGLVGQLLFMTVTAFVVARTTDDPSAAATADALAGSTFIIGLPAALLTAVHWRSLRPARAGSAGREQG